MTDFVSKQMSSVRPAHTDPRTASAPPDFLTLSKFANAIDAFIAVVDHRGGIFAFNHVAERTTGYAFSEIGGQRFCDLVPTSDREAFETFFGRLADSAERQTIERHWTGKDGGRRLIAWSLQALPGNTDGAFFGILTGVDITDLRAFQRKKLEYEQILDGVSEAIVRVNEDYLIESCNPAAENLYGYRQAELVGKPNSILAPETEEDSRVAFLSKLVDSGNAEKVETRRRRKDGSEFDVELRVSPLRSETDDIVGWVSIGFDISERKRQDAELTQLAQNDPLTGLCNRRHLMTLADQEVARARRYGRELCLILCDFDYFKAINDSFGHAACDRVLKSFAALGLQQLREGVDVFSRIGGEEFVILLPETAVGDAGRIAERLRVAVAGSPLVHEGEAIDLSASFGVASWQSPDKTIEQTIRRADHALYDAKAQGRNRVVMAVV